MEALTRALDTNEIAACTIGSSGRSRFMVSVRRARVDGWEVYYGDDLEETIERAIAAGPQSEDLTGGLV